MTHTHPNLRRILALYALVAALTAVSIYFDGCHGHAPAHAEVHH